MLAAEAFALATAVFVTFEFVFVRFAVLVTGCAPHPIIKMRLRTDTDSRANRAIYAGRIGISPLKNLKLFEIGKLLYELLLPESRKTNR